MSQTDDSPSPEPETPQQSQMRDRMSAVGRVIASAAGAIATIGGVIGVYQLVASPNDKTTGIETAQDMIVAMVDQQVISLEDASRIAFALSGESRPNGEGAAESIQKIAATGTENQRKAIQLLSERRTREEGLELLKSEAKTSSDWQTVAIFANGTDSELAIEAIKKSIALEPDNFESLTLLSRLQSSKGDFADARRSVATASLLAETPLEKLYAAQSTLSIVRQAGDVPAMESNIPKLLSAIDQYETSVDLSSAPSSVAFGEYRKEPLYVSGRARSTLASAYIYLDRNKAQQAGLETMLDGANATEALAVETQENADLAIEQAALAIKYFQKLAPTVDVEDRYFVVSNNIGAHQTTAYAYFSKGENDTAVEYTTEIMDLVRAEAETGSRAAIEALPQYYSFHSTYLYQQGDFEKVLETTRRSTDLQIAYARKYETEDIDLKIAGIEFSYAINAIPLGEDIDAEQVSDEYFSALEARIASDPEDEDDFMEIYMSRATGVSSLYSSDRFGLKSSDKAIAFLDRPIAFHERMISEHGETHDRVLMRYFLKISKGDVYFNLLEPSKALAEYQAAYDMADTIPPDEDEPDVVELSQLSALYRIGVVNDEPSEKAIRDGLELAERLDSEGRLSTAHQNVYNQLLQLASARGIKAN